MPLGTSAPLPLCPLYVLSYLCVLERDVLTLFAPSGRVYAVPLPFHGKRVWPLERGIIVERYRNTFILTLIFFISLAWPSHSHFHTAMAFVL